jgi:hypothetical protein
MIRHRVGILLFPDVEVLDFCGPYEVFSVTRLHEERRRRNPRRSRWSWSPKSRDL